ncbi:MAG: hypothetical protein LBF86_02590 [Helicobacteraceae bacterium]|jgi:hypothetical protein|nr:hypothetical protein [Helicobacteraceae bacterium]
MINKIIKDGEFAEMIAEHCADILDYLILAGTSFGILCDLNEIVFDPPLPESLNQSFKPLTLFVLSDYTLESAEIDEDTLTLSFEAGFGEQNFGSVVSAPIDSIIQILVEDTAIFLNLSALPQNRKVKPSRTNTGGDASADRSMQSFLDNPENKRFFKK